jgi:hypothetical protein
MPAAPCNWQNASRSDHRVPGRILWASLPPSRLAIGYVQAAVWYFQKKVGTGYPTSSRPATVQTLDPHAPFVTNG